MCGQSLAAALLHVRLFWWRASKRPLLLGSRPVRHDTAKMTLPPLQACGTPEALSHAGCSTCGLSGSPPEVVLLCYPGDCGDLTPPSLSSGLDCKDSGRMVKEQHPADDGMTKAKAASAARAPSLCLNLLRGGNRPRLKRPHRKSKSRQKDCIRPRASAQ